MGRFIVTTFGFARSLFRSKWTLAFICLFVGFTSGSINQIMSFTKKAHEYAMAGLVSRLAYTNVVYNTLVDKKLITVDEWRSVHPSIVAGTHAIVVADFVVDRDTPISDFMRSPIRTMLGIYEPLNKSLAAVNITYVYCSHSQEDAPAFCSDPHWDPSQKFWAVNQNFTLPTAH